MQPLNSPIEVAIRVLIILRSVYPSGLDINRLVLYDYSMLHSADLGGPASIHPAVPGRSGEMGMKRTLIQQGLQILQRAGLAHIAVNHDGLVYSASEDAPGFITRMNADYAQKLTERATWVATEFSGSNDGEIRGRLASIFSAWSEEFGTGGGDKP